MAFMVPLVKNHYDIYARNNPADHLGAHPPHPHPHHPDNSLFLSATSVGKNGSRPVTKQYRIVISGGKVVGAGAGSKSAASKKNVPNSGVKAPALTQSPGGKLYYRMPSASISLPVVARPNSAPTSGAKPPTKSEPTSPQSVSPPSRPLPHVRRTVRNPLTNRVYSYSVSIPDYVAEEDEELAEEDEEEEDDDELTFSLDDEEDKENQDLILFSTSAPAGTGPIVAATPSPPPAKVSQKKTKKAQTQPIISSPDSGVIQSSGRVPHQRTLSATSTTSTTSSATNSREYVELLRKFILHLKMLKIGGKSSGKRRTKSSPTNNNPVEDFPVENAQVRQQRKRKDTMEDSNHL